ITLDNLDGSYSTVLVLAEKEGLPALRFELAVPEAKQDDALVIDPNGQSGRKVKLVLNKVQVLDDKDPCWLGAGEIAFDAVVAPNANPSRAVRTRLPEKGHFTISSGQTV